MIPRTFKYVIHDDLFPRLCTEADQHKVLGVHGITSAGFAAISATPEGDIQVSCWGESIGLRIKSKGEQDAALIRCMFVESSL